MIPRSLAALATIPGREAALAGCLASLRPQVEQLRVICHDMTEPPPAVREFADQWVCEPDKAGSAAGLRWAREWKGLYLKCDDDFRYPTDYVETMLRWVKRWKGKALVVCHGRRFAEDAEKYLDAELAVAPQTSNGGAWLNYPGGCAMAWDTRLKVPHVVPEKNLEEAYLALWAQQQRVPIWLIPKAAGWLAYLLPNHQGPTIWQQEKSQGFKNRNRLIAQQAKRGWQVYSA